MKIGGIYGEQMVVYGDKLSFYVEQLCFFYMVCLKNGGFTMTHDEHMVLCLKNGGFTMKHDEFHGGFDMSKLIFNNMP